MERGEGERERREKVTRTLLRKFHPLRLLPLPKHSCLPFTCSRSSSLCLARSSLPSDLSLKVTCSRKPARTTPPLCLCCCHSAVAQKLTFQTHTGRTGSSPNPRAELPRETSSLPRDKREGREKEGERSRSVHQSRIPMEGPAGSGFWTKKLRPSSRQGGLCASAPRQIAEIPTLLASQTQ